MKKNYSDWGELCHSLKKTLLIMRIALFLLIVGFLQTHANDAYAQKTKVSVSFANTELAKVLDQIEIESEFFFLYNEKLIDANRKVSIEAKDERIDEVLKMLFTGTNIEYTISDRKIILAPVNMSESQQIGKKISGKVTDSSGATLPGVSVVVKGTTNGVITDNDGGFSLSNVPENAVLQFSFVGMKAQEIAVLGKATFNVKLEEETVGIEEVVAIGYGTQKKVNLTGAVTAITGEDIALRQVGQTSMALQGIAPGVTITQRNGEPGLDGGNIRIRGIGTLNNANPLVLVDGVEMSMNNIDPGTIESISVLKDAASSSIYGSRAANGVILITTKRGKEGSFSLSYNSYIGVQNATNLPHKVNAIDHMTLLNEAYTNIGRSALYSDAYIQEYKQNMGSKPDLYPDTDWQKEVLTGSGVQTNHFLSLSGGNEKLKVSCQFGAMDQKGLIEGVSFKRYFVRINSDIKISNKISGAFDLYVSNQNRNSVAEFPANTGGAINAESSTGTIFGMMNKLPAVQAAIYSNGLYGEGQNGVNPLAILKEGGFYNKIELPITGNFSLNYKPFDFLTAKVTYSPSYSQPQEKSFVNIIKTYSPDGTLRFAIPGKNYSTETINKNRFDHFEGTLTFSKLFDQHSVTALGGYQYESYKNDGFNAFRDVFLFPEYTVLSAGSKTNMQNAGWATEYTLISYFGRINYNYKERYLFESNVRFDGSSRFSQGNKWGVFPSFSFGWRLSEEKFMSSLRNKIDNLKFRASWGQLGNQNIGSNYPFASIVSLTQGYVSNGAIQDGAAITDLANTDISWESSEMTNVGVDVTIKKKLSASFDYYQKNTTGILLRLDIPLTMGVTAPFQNAGVVQNKGWDFQVDYHNSIGKFDFSTTFTLSDVKNKVVDLEGITQQGTIVNHEGYPMNSFFLYDAIGLITSSDMDSNGKYTGPIQFGNVQPGDIKYKDKNNDGLINTLDKKILGSTIPRYTYSLNLTLKYQNFDFIALVQGIGKVDGYISGNGNIPFSLGGTIYEYQKDRWTKENPNPDAMFPRLAFNETNNPQYSDYWMKSAAYLRVKNIQLGYTLSKSILNRFDLKNLRFYLSAENLFTFDNFWPDADPEISPGSSAAYYPQVKSYNVGLSVTF